jgi:hypothetical protein
LSGRRRETARLRLLREASAYEQLRERAESIRASIHDLDELKNAEDALDEAALVRAKELGWKPPAATWHRPVRTVQ